MGGIESDGMLCGPEEVGFPSDVLNPEKPFRYDKAEAGAPIPPYEEVVPPKAKDAKADKGKKKKGGKAAKEDDEDLDALLNEFKPEEPAKEAAADPKAKAKAKGKAKAGKAAK